MTGINLAGSTPDIAEENIAKLKQIFPDAFEEGKVDFDKLKQDLGEYIDEDSDRYNFTWHGKGQALRLAQTPSTGTLRPCKEESKNWDTTQNLYIEGDNLEVLKLLQKSYHGKVKMIYIDPPYNTGHDFVYSDDYKDNLENYLQLTKQVDEDNRKIGTNSDASGRYHTNWLNMMYPRLRLARNLLTEDGTMCFSIDNNELTNVIKLTDEIFGENNRIGIIVWKNATDNNPTNIATEHEYIVFYAKNKENVDSQWKSKISDIKHVLVDIGNKLNAEYGDSRLLQEVYSNWFSKNKLQLWPLDRYKYIDIGGVYTGSQSVHNPGREGYRYDVMHPKTQKPCVQPLMGYRFPPDTMQKLINDGRIIFGEDENKIVELKVYAKDYQEKLSSWMELDGRLGSYDLKGLFDQKSNVFTNPKPVKLLKYLFSFILGENDILLDFFSGSATTAHSVMQLNAEDGGNRKFIMVQLPEPCDEQSEAFKAGYKNICEIGKERIRRAGEKIKAELGEKQNGQTSLIDDSAAVNPDDLDIGFKVLELNSSNLKKWNPDYDQLELSLKNMIGNYVPGRTELDVVYEIMLKYGLQPTLPVEQRKVPNTDCNVYSIALGALVICLDDNITADVANEIVRLNRELQPENGMRAVFKDIGFKDDSVKTNTIEILKLGGVAEFVTI